MGWLQRLLGSADPADTPRPPETPQPPEVSAADVAMVETTGQRLVQIVNESMQIADTSKNVETRRSRVGVARAKIEELRALAAEFSFVKIRELDAVERDLAKIDRETDLLGGSALASFIPRNFDVTCDCGTEFGVPLSSIDAEYACPGCGELSQFTPDQVAAIRAVVTDAQDKVAASLGSLTGFGTEKAKF